MKTLIIATRQSPLALAQAEWVAQQLKIHYPDLSIQLLGLVTQGDKITDTPLDKIGGKGLFVKELENALIEHRADIAVHSMKDVPAVLPAELCIPVICTREDPRDVWVSHRFKKSTDITPGARIGTSSVRRESQLRAHYPDISIQLLRGNIDTRLKKLDEGHYDAIILAAAGLIRLNKKQYIQQYFESDFCLPAAGQGALGIECREKDTDIKNVIAVLRDEHSDACVTAERAVTRALNGSCTAPIAALADIHHQQLRCKALVGSRDGKKIIRAEYVGHPSKAIAIGMRVADDLRAQGAQDILDECY